MFDLVRVFGLVTVVLLGLCAAPGQALAGPPVACNTEQDFAVLRSAFAGRVPFIAAAPATPVLPADGSAGVLLRLPYSSSDPSRTYRAFETSSSLVNAGTHGMEVAVLSLAPAPASSDATAVFDATTSEVLRLAIRPRPLPLWSQRPFVLVACSGGAFVGWSEIVAPVSDPVVAWSICAAVSIAIYLLATMAVSAARKQPSPLSTKYPALFGQPALKGLDHLNPIHLIANAFNQGSVQKLQVLLFTFLIGALVVSLVLQTGELISLSPTIVGLLGVSGIGAAAAQIAYQQRTRLSFDNWSWLERKSVLKPPPAPTGPRWRDLVLTNREFDVYKLQTIIFSVGVAFGLLSAGARELSTFTVPDTLLGILGLSQIVYVGGVLVRPPAVADLDNAITKLRAAAQTLAIALDQGTDTGPDGRLLPALAPGQAPGVNAKRQYDEQADDIVPMIESALEVQADRSKL